MKVSTIARTALVGIVSASLLSCGGGGGGGEPSNPAVILAPQTKPLDQAAANSLSVSQDGTTLSMSSASPVAQSLVKGDVLPIGITPSTPRGRLSKVTAVSASGSQIAVTTTPATLADTFKQAHFALHSTLGPNSFATAKALQAGVTISTDDAEIRTRHLMAVAKALSDPCAGNAQTLIEMKHVTIAQDSNGSVTADGTVEICPSFDFNWDIGGVPIALNSLTATATLGGDVHVTLNGNYQNSFAHQIPIASLVGNPIPIDVGGVPLVVTPKVTFFVGASGQVTGSFSAGAAQAATVTGGITYSKGAGTSPVFAHSIQFAADPVQVGATLTTQANAGVTLDLLIDEIAAVELSPQAFVELDADVHQDPWWTLSAGFDVPGKVSVTVFGIATLADFPFPDALRFSSIIDHANAGSSPTLTSIQVTPANPSIAIGGTKQFSALGHYSDNSSQDLTGIATWTSSNPSVATISNSAGSKGLANGVASGSTTISAAYNNLAGSTTLTVTSATTPTVSVAASPPSITTGQSSTLMWSSSNVTSCTASNSSGSGQWTGNQPLNGSIQVSPMATTTYTLTCNGSSGTVSNGATVTVAGQTQQTQLITLHSFTDGQQDGQVPLTSLIQGRDGSLYGTTDSNGPFSRDIGYGTIYRVTPAGVETVLFDIGNGIGNKPSAIIQGSDGSFYGTTIGGGYSGTTRQGGSTSCAYNQCGTVFKFTLGDTVPGQNTGVLYEFRFRDAPDGASPRAGLIQGRDGNFYGTTSVGGLGGRGSNCADDGCGTVFKLTPAGVETILHQFVPITGFGQQPAGDGASPVAALVQASDGNFYGTTSVGGLGNGTVFKISPSGTESVLYSFAGGGDGANPVAALVQASDDNFYGTTRNGGSHGYGTVFKVTPAGAETVLYSFAQGNDGANPTAALVHGVDGNFYGTTLQGGSSFACNLGCGTVFRVSPTGIETVLHSFNGGDGSLPAAALLRASDGNFYGTTQQGGQYGDGTVFKLVVGN